MDGNEQPAIACYDRQVATLNAARIAGKTEAEIRELVAKLETARKTAA